MTSKKFYIRSYQIKRNAEEFVNGLQPDNDKPMVVEIKPVTRSLDQNSKLHALFGDLAKSELTFAGKCRSLEQWKVIMISGHSVATGGEGEVVAGVEGELIALRESSAKMGVKRMSSLIEYVIAYCAMNGVKLSDVKHDFYDGSYK